MKKRPKLVPGDFVKFSKKSPDYYIWKDSVMIVKKILKGDGSNKEDEILIRDKEGFKATYLREELWFTGANVMGTAYDREVKIEDFFNKVNQIKDNDGRATCFRCHSPTQKVYTGFSTKFYNICPKCKI